MHKIMIEPTPVELHRGGPLLETVNTTEMISRYDLRMTKSLGQNFLTDIHIIDKIVHAGNIGPDDLVLEVGPGIGSMTLQLAKAAGKVVAVEIDKHLIPPLEEVLGKYTNVSIIHADILKTDLHDLVAGWKGQLKVVSNLPYYITTPIIMHLLESDIPWHTLVFMVQKEVAQRMAAEPGNKDYSALTIGIRCLADPKLCFVVSKNCFYPKPDVDSAVVRLIAQKRPYLESVNMKDFRQVVKASFSQRRKTITNSLGSAPWLKGGKQSLRDVLETMKIPESIRAERLTLEQFAEITKRIEINIRKDVVNMEMKKMARYLDHAVLKPDMNREEAKEAILLGVKYHVKTVCVRPCDVAMAVELCKNTETEVSCTLSFPHGNTTPEVKAFEAKKAIEAGTKEIDMVANYGFIRSGLKDEVLADFQSVTGVAKPAGILVKIILETTALTLDEVKFATEIAIEAGADFVKTSTGFHTGGASVEAVKVMLDTAKGRIKVKASGGIRSYEDAVRFVEMGCERLGVGSTSTPVICDHGTAGIDTVY